MCRTTSASSIRGVLVALVLVVALSLFCESASAAQAAVKLPGAKSFKEVKIIGGERLVLTGGKVRSLEKNVELEFIAASEEDENVTVKADRMDFSYAEETEEPSLVVAKGNVHFIMRSSRRELRADTVTWFTAENRAEFQGNPTVVSEEGTLTGRSVIHYFGENRTVVEKPRGTFLIPEKEDTEKQGKKQKENES